MSISSFTVVTMLDSRPAPITIAMPYTKDIPNRVISFKDIYGSAQMSTIILVTRNGDVFENSTFSTIMSNAFETMTFHAGLPNRWHRIEGTTNYGGLTTSTLNTRTISTNVAFITTISSAGVYSKFYGDGSQLTNLPTTFDGPAIFSAVNIQTVANICNTSTGLITASNISSYNISTNFAYLSNISTNLLGANTARINTLNVAFPTFDNLSTNTTTNLFGLTVSGGTVLSNTLTATTMVISNTLTVSGNNLTRLIGTLNLCNTLSSTYVSASNISTHIISNNNASFSVLSNISQTGGDIRASNISANTISTNFISACNVSTNYLSTTFGNMSNVSTSLVQMITASINTLTVNTMTASNVAITTINVTNISTSFITARDISTFNLSNTSVYVSNLSNLTLGAGSAFINTLSTTSIRQSNVSTQNVSTNSFSTSVLTFGSTIGGSITASNISVITISTNYITANSISTFNLSTNLAFVNNLSTNLLGAVTANITNLTAGATVLATLGVPASGSAAFASLTVQGNTVLSNTLNVANAFTASNNFNVIGNFATTLGGTLSLSNTLSTNLITACNISTHAISTNNAYLSNLSNITLNGRAGNFSTLTIYDGATTSTGTFRFATLTGLVTPQTVNLLYFNNFVFAGTNVWPGQTITALNWGMSCNGTAFSTPIPTPTFGITATDITNYYIASNVTGGSGPYFLENTDPDGSKLSDITLFVGDGTTLPFGLVNGEATLYTQYTNYTYNFTLRDSSYPVALVRYITINIELNGDPSGGGGGGTGSASGT